MIDNKKGKSNIITLTQLLAFNIEGFLLPLKKVIFMMLTARSVYYVLKKYIACHDVAGTGGSG